MKNTTESKNIPYAVAQGGFLLGLSQVVTQFLGQSRI